MYAKFLIGRDNIYKSNAINWRQVGIKLCNSYDTPDEIVTTVVRRGKSDHVGPYFRVLCTLCISLWISS